MPLNNIETTSFFKPKITDLNNILNTFGDSKESFFSNNTN